MIGAGKGWSKGKAFVPRQTCQQCAKEFYAPPVLIRRGGGKFCSRKCAVASRALREKVRTVKICAGCGNEYLCYPSHVKRSRFCSKKCVHHIKEGHIKEGHIKERYTKEKHCAACGKLLVNRLRKYCSRTCYAASNTGSNNCNWRGGNQMIACSICGVEFEAKRGQITAGYAKFCSRACHGIFKGQNAEKTHTRARGGRREDLGNRYFRSSWEANWARYLNWLIQIGEIRSWEYEIDTFEFSRIKRGNRTYTPDFKITNSNGSTEYHEVKGYMDKSSKTKLDRMARYYPNIRVILIDEPAYKAIASQFKRSLPGWE